MALTVETGTGVPGADSYISLADANTYVSNHGNSAVWSAAADASKEQALRLATQYIDLKYGDRFKGCKTWNTQAKRQNLQWPRQGAIDNDGYEYPDDAMPACLVSAVVEAALRIIAGDDLLGVIETGTIASESSTVGPLSQSISYIGGKMPMKQYPKIDALIRPLINSSTQMMRG